MHLTTSYMETAIIPLPGFSEPVSSMTHLFGTVPFALAAVIVILRAVQRPHWGGRVFWISVLIFATMFMLSMSGVYHLLEPGGTARLVLQYLDHAAIFTLIAGTFITAHGILFTGVWRWGMVVLMLAVIATAIPLVMVYFSDMPEWLSLTLYLTMGWLGVISGVKLWRRFGYRFIRFLLWGGIAYSIGAVAEFMRQPVLMEGVFGPHEFFHVAVLVGLACHWIFVWQIADGRTPMTEEEARQLKTVEGVQDSLYRGVPIVADYGVRVEAVGQGFARARLPYATRLLRPGGSISGPALMALIDTAMYALLLHDYGHSDMDPSSDVRIRFLDRHRRRDMLAEARSLLMDEDLLVIEVVITGDDAPEPFAQASGTYKLPALAADKS